MALTPGTRIGPYEVTAPIGVGGMGEVYRASDSRLNRDVALKVMPASVALDPDRLARFRREAQVLASLNHPNIAHVYGLEQAGDMLAISMELVEGPTLADLLSRPDHRAVGLTDALAIGRQIAEALEFAHESGVVHRDLKPANIKVRPDGTVKVLDFGLAKALDPAGGSSSGSGEGMNSPTLTARATQLGVILGTAAYMAPEQAKGKPVDRRADIWAFGVVLYEMVSGRRGYEAEDISDTLAAVLTRDVDWSALPPDTPPRLRALLQDCLTRDPKQRLRDIGEARRVLEQLSGVAPASMIAQPSVSIGAVATPPSRLRSAIPWVIAGLAILTAIVVAVLPRQPPPTATVVTRAQLPLKDLGGFVELSRDGTKLVYTVSGNSGFYLALRQLDQFDGKPLAGSEGGLFPLFSPNAEWIAFTSQESVPKIKKIPTAGGPAITLAEGNFQNGATWGDDETIVFWGPKGLLRVPSTGGTPKPLTTLDATKGETRHTRPQFLPGGQRLLFTVVSSSPESPQFALLDLKTGKYQTVAKGGDNGRYVPTGHLTFVRDATMFALPFDLERSATTGAEAPVIEAVSTQGPPSTADYTFSRNGTLVYSKALTQQGSTLSWMDRKGVLQPIAGQVPRQWGTGRLSPEGLRVANAIEGAKGRDIWVVDLVRGTPTRLSFGGENDLPIWTPDGQRVLYGSLKDGKSGLYSVAADGSSPPELVIATTARPTPLTTTPDGKTLFYRDPGAAPGRILVLPPAVQSAAREPHSLRETTGADTEASMSPDGKWIAFTSTESGGLEVYVLPFPGPGPKVRISTDGGRSVRWARSGRELFYWTPTPGVAVLYSVSIQSTPTLVAGVPRELFRYFSGTTWDVAPNGERFLVEAVGAQGTGATFATVTGWFDELKRRAPGKKNTEVLGEKNTEVPADNNLEVRVEGSTEVPVDKNMEVRANKTAKTSKNIPTRGTAKMVLRGPAQIRADT